MCHKCVLKVAAQAVFRGDAGSRFQACGPTTEDALDPTDEDTRGISYCMPTIRTAFTLYFDEIKQASIMTIIMT